MKEYNFQSEIRDSVKFFWPTAHYYKIPDAGADPNDFAKRPYDAYWVLDNLFCAFEYKQIKQPNGFPFDRVEPHQIYNLMQVNSALQKSFLLINYRFSFSEKQCDQYETTSQKHNFVVALTVSDFLVLKYWQENFHQRKSIPFEWIWDQYIMHSPYIIFWEKIKNHLVWNLQILFS